MQQDITGINSYTKQFRMQQNQTLKQPALKCTVQQHPSLFLNCCILLHREWSGLSNTVHKCVLAKCQYLYVILSYLIDFFIVRKEQTLFLHVLGVLDRRIELKNVVQPEITPPYHNTTWESTVWRSLT